MELRVIGQHRCFIMMDLNTATVQDLKQAVARESGLAVEGLKLLAGGKQLKDDASTLAQCGVNPKKPIMVLRQDLSEQVRAEGGLNRRTEEVAQAASRLSARAARDIVGGESVNAWGRWGQEGRGRTRSGGSGRAGMRNDLPQIELTNQDGEALTIPPEDSAALMEGMMLHRQGLACIAHAEGSTGASPAAMELPKAHASGDDDTVLRRRPGHPSATEALLTPASSNEGQGDDALPREAGTVPRGNVLHEPKESAPRDGGLEERKGGEGNEGRGGDVPVDSGSQEAAGFVLASEVARSSGGCAGVEAAEGGESFSSSSTTTATVNSALGPNGKGKGKGKGKLKSASPRSGAKEGHLPSSTEKRLAQREALGLLFKAEEAFRRCDPKYLECVDNYAYLCLDIVWLLFLMKDMSNLDLASRMLVSVEAGFQKAHGPGLQRLAALKGEYCAEKLLYVRLHLLQGVVAFLQGDSGKASGLLIRASEEAKALKPDPTLAARLVRKWRMVNLENLRLKVALLALRAGRNNLDAAWQYLESLRHRQETVKREREGRMDQRRARRFGLTADKKSYVDASLVVQLTEGGFPRQKAISALRRHNNNVEAALTFLTAAQANTPSSLSTGNDDEALAVLLSLGVPPEAAREALERAGVLCDALRELGIDPPEGMATFLQESGGARSKNSLQRASGTGGEAAVEERKSSDEGKESAGGMADDSSSGIGLEGPTEEEKRLFEELAADRKNQDEEGYLNISLQDEADAADMYLYLCRGNIPLTFDLDKVRAGLAAAAVEDKCATVGDDEKM